MRPSSKVPLFLYSSSTTLSSIIHFYLLISLATRASDKLIAPKKMGGKDRETTTTKEILEESVINNKQHIVSCHTAMAQKKRFSSIPNGRITIPETKKKQNISKRERENLIFIRSSRVATLATDRELLRENLDRRQEGETLSC